jgi:hypothetical protein
MKSVKTETINSEINQNKFNIHNWYILFVFKLKILNYIYSSYNIKNISSI